jgi:hypothetical protein
MRGDARTLAHLPATQSRATARRPAGSGPCLGRPPPAARGGAPAVKWNGRSCTGQLTAVGADADPTVLADRAIHEVGSDRLSVS